MKLTCGVIPSLKNEVLYFTFQSNPDSVSTLGIESNLQEATKKSMGAPSTFTSLDLGKVHSKVLRFFLFFLKEPIYNTMRHHLYHTVVFQGHSLAGAYATLAAAYFGHLRSTKVHCITYGAPKVGDKIFCQRFRRVVEVSYRIVNDQDPIPKYPKDTKGHCYKHVFGKVKHKLNVPVRSPHKLENYILNDMYDTQYLRYNQVQECPPNVPPKVKRSSAYPYEEQKNLYANAQASPYSTLIQEEDVYEVATTTTKVKRDLKIRSCIEPMPPKFNMGVSALKLKGLSSDKVQDKPYGI